METFGKDSVNMTTGGVKIVPAGRDSLPFSYVVKDTLPEKTEPALSEDEYLQSLFPSFQTLKEYATSTVYQPKDLLSQVPRKEGVPMSQSVQQTVWFTPLLLFLAVFYSAILVRHSKTLLQEVREFFHPKSRNDMFNSSVTEVSRLRLIMGGFSILSTVLYCYFALTGFFSVGRETPTYSMLKILLVAIAYLAFKILSIILVNYTFFEGMVAGVLKRSYSTLTTWLGLGLFVCDLFIAYAPQSVADGALMAGLVVCGCGVLLYVYKILTIFFEGFTSLFYLILYLCTLEILPSVALIIGLVNIV